jgi:hypothetical protein
MAVLGGVAVSYERGTPVAGGVGDCCENIFAIELCDSAHGWKL